MPNGSTLAALRDAVNGVTYPSDTDAPWTPFAWPDAAGTPTVAEVKRRGGQKPAAPAKEQSLDDLFAPLVAEQDWYGADEKADAAKNRALLATLKANLADPKVFRVGTRKVAVYVVGGAKDGSWAGIKTISVET